MSATHPLVTLGRPVRLPTKRRVFIIVTAGAVAVTAAVSLRHLAEVARPAVATMAASTAFSILAQDQQSVDRISDPRARFLAPVESTRYLGQTAGGRFYLGVSGTGDACLITIAVGSVPERSCTAVPADRSIPTLTLHDPAGSGIALVADGYRTSKNWQAISANLIVQRPD